MSFSSLNELLSFAINYLLNIIHIVSKPKVLVILYIRNNVYFFIFEQNDQVYLKCRNSTLMFNESP